MITTSLSSDSKSDFISFICVLFTTSREVSNIDSQLTSVHVGWAKVLITEVWEVLTLHRLLGVASKKFKKTHINDNHSAAGR